MATSDTQATLGQFGVHHYRRGELLEEFGTGRSTKVRLRECPLCRMDPTRQRHHFTAGENRADHFRRHHGPGDV